MKELIKSSILNFANPSLTDNALAFFKTLGYDTSITITQTDKTYKSFKENFIDNSPNKDRFNEFKAFKNDWKSFDFLFQLADNLLGVKGGKVDNQIINSVVFACIELTAPTYSRTQLAEITRQVNLVFAMPVVLIFKYNDSITLSVIHRRINKKDEQKDVLEKVSLIKDISISNPHRAQIEILYDFAFQNLANKKNPNNFVELTQAWETVFSTKALNKQFFKKIANWYFLSVAYSKFPYEYLKLDPKHQDKTNEELQELANQKATIRFITRMIFVWFLKEKGLIPVDLFDTTKVAKLLKKFNNENSSDYYNAILQNLFFATLNKAKEHREFALKKSFHKNKANHDVNSLYRYENLFQDSTPENIMKLFEDIPFLNGGLFDSLDNKEAKEIIDGFSRNEKWQATMPDYLFFNDEGFDFDEELREIYGTKKEKYEVKGLFEIFNEYKFTIEENTPSETDVALDPYLLGEIFENLLAYYNPETGTTARKGSGSFYTPQEIVNYMVDESLNAYLQTKLTDSFVKVSNFDKADALSLQEKTQIVKALSDVKILDPACGSGAFPMGVLYKMVDLLKHIDPDNSIWKQIQHDKIIGDKIAELEADKKAIQGLSDKQVKEKATKAVEDRLNELETIFNNEYNFDDYARKLYIIQNCIYGVDIQDVAIQISKLRFFLSLIVDQKNEDIKPLPNLETKFVIANTLIGIDLPKFTVMGEDDHSQDTTKALKEELKHVREHHFKAVTRKEKLAIKAQDKAIREKIANSLADSMNSYKQEDIDKLNEEIATQKRLLAEAELMPDMVQEIIVRDLFGGESTTKVNYRKERIKECMAQMRIVQNKIESLQTNTQAEQIRTQALKIAQWDIYNQNAHADWFDMDWMFGITDGFDVVIGNPPYVEARKIEQNYIDYFRKNFLSCGNRINLFTIFIEKGINLLSSEGIITYIIPRNSIRSNDYRNLRKFILKNTNILNILSFKNGVFDNVTSETTVLILENGKNQQNEVKVEFLETTINQNLDIKNVKNINQGIFETLPDFRFNIYLDNLLINLLNKIKENTKEMSIIANITQGIIVGDEKRLISNFKEKINYKPILRGKNISRYNSKFNNEFVNYLPGTKLLTRGKTPDLFEKKEKILTQHISSKIIATLDTENYYYLQTINGLYSINDEISNKFLLAIINSKLMNFNYEYCFNMGAEFTTAVAIENLSLLPIKEIPLKSQQPLIALVDQILESKKQGKDTSALEHQIDVMVYHLYELSYEEACVIDVGLSKQDFEKYKL